MKHYALGFLLGAGAQYLAAALFLDIPPSALLLIIAFSQFAAAMRVSRFAPVQPTPTWCVYLAAFGPITFGSSTLSIVAIVLSLEEVKAFSRLPGKIVVAACCSFAVVAIWTTAFAYFRKIETARRNLYSTDSASSSER